MIRAFPASALVAVGIAVATSAVHAQTPTRLTPSTAPTSLHQPAPQSTPAGPLRLTPRRAAPSATPSDDAATASAPRGNLSVGTASRKSIQVEGLSEIDPNSVGSLSVENGGFGEDMWLGTPRSLIESLLPQLPVAIRSPVLRDLQRRLLLSGAVMPPASEENSATPAPSHQYADRCAAKYGRLQGCAETHGVDAEARDRPRTSCASRLRINCSPTITAARAKSWIRSANI